jgi:hypothetical protein
MFYNIQIYLHNNMHNCILHNILEHFLGRGEELNLKYSIIIKTLILIL